MAIFTIFGHDPYGQKYGHDRYPWKDHKQTYSLVKKSSDLGVWIKSYGKNNELEFFGEKLFFQI